MFQNDYDKQKFKEANFSIIVKKCRLGKNRAKGFLKLLLAKEFVKKRADGYMIWHRINKQIN